MDWEGFFAVGALSVLLVLALLSAGLRLSRWLLKEYGLAFLHRPFSRKSLQLLALVVSCALLAYAGQGLLAVDAGSAVVAGFVLSSVSLYLLLVTLVTFAGLFVEKRLLPFIRHFTAVL